jgi:sigma-E factor negative regulatory protein RseA
MNDDISAFVDGELDPESSARFLQRMKNDDGLMQAWRDYHLIGDALRGDARRGLDASFARRLDAEPTILAPRALVAANNSHWMKALSAAAGVAAVAAAAWVALPQFAPDSQLPIAKNESSSAAPVSIASRDGFAKPDQARLAGGGSDIPVAVGVEDYLLAHQRFSPASSMQGVAPYVRTVSAERKGDAR